MCCVQIFLFGNCDLNVTHFHVFSISFLKKKGLEPYIYQKMKTEENEQPAVEVSDYLQQSQEVKIL
jgi:hypothetical protein